MKNKFKIIGILLIGITLILTSCNKNKNQEVENTGQVAEAENKNEINKYDIEFYDTFDTVVNISIYSDDKDFAEENLKYAQTRFEELHKLFDNYKNYEKIINVKSINDDAGTKSIVVDDTLYELIRASVDNYYNISHKTNIALGPVTEVWNKYREEYESGKSKEEVIEKYGREIPSDAELESLRPLTNMDNVKLNDEKKSVEIEKGMKLDLGATAKGFATEIVARELKQRGVSSAIISAGGNVRAIGSPGDGREYYKVGIQNPDLNSKEPTIAVLKLKDKSAVTSGDYQRYFEVDGIRYSHIIDPDTLKPSSKLSSVTVVTEDSGLADFLSTAAFNSTSEEISEITNKTNSSIIWQDKESKMFIDNDNGEIILDE